VDPIWAWLALGSGLLLSGGALGVGLHTARSAGFLRAERHEARCQKRADEVEEDFRKLRREYASLSQEVTADVETAALERNRAQAAKARAVKAEKRVEQEQSEQAPPLPEDHATFRARMMRERYGRH
jgi:hypothetical protein